MDVDVASVKFSAGSLKKQQLFVRCQSAQTFLQGFEGTSVYAFELHSSQIGYLSPVFGHGVGASSEMGTEEPSVRYSIAACGRPEALL
ncbi:hypothetical protein AV530_001616 [Patagioenas fasciata monilis]|uniref:Uncharacterized protein n=1 Tax=Patagioenas fasciata monilis TaxID=372326 RepID=A0A1V4K554_PATFA|nr:hypothetical protein AV530_001616 [Patagioenas fasciata monilis]